MRYDQLRDVVAKRKPGWEYLQDVSFLSCTQNIVLVAMAIWQYLCSYFAMEDTSSVEFRYAGDSSSC